VVAVFSAAGSEVRRPIDGAAVVGTDRLARVLISEAHAASQARTAAIAWRTVSAAAGASDLLTPPRRGDSLIATCRAVTAEMISSSLVVRARVSSATTSSAMLSEALPLAVSRPGSGSASSTARASGWAGSG
jgi:hypothetical protein